MTSSCGWVSSSVGLRVRPYRLADEEAVVALWESCGLSTPSTVAQ